MSSLLDLFTARSPVSYYFTVRPFAVFGWTDGGTSVGISGPISHTSYLPNKSSTFSVLFILPHSRPSRVSFIVLSRLGAWEFRMISKGIPQSVDLLRIIIEADQNVRKGIRLPDDKAMHRFAENNAKLIVSELVEPMLEKAAAESKMTHSWKNPWWNHRHREGIERDLVSLVQTALSRLAKDRPEYFLSYISRKHEKTPLYAELTLHAIEKMPVSYANDVIKWLISDFNGNAFEKTSGEKTELTACQRIIERFSPYCSEHLFEKLEEIICQWSPDKETICSILEYRSQLRKEWNNWAYFPPFWGDLQYLLLPSLDRLRLSNRSSELLAVLERKFPDGTRAFNIIVTTVEKWYRIR